jgi:L-arabinose transport system substrate-binding protein
MYVTLVETYCDQEVDGFVLNARVDINERLYEIISEAGIPVLFESNAIADANGTLLTSGIELNAYDCGAGASQWIVDNYTSLGFNYDDQSTLGFIGITYSAIDSFTNRYTGATETFQAAFPDASFYTADLITQGEISPEAAYTEVSAILGAHPEIMNWAIVGVLDDWGQGAARAVEAAGLEDNTIITSVGGELLTIEWDNGYEGCWVMCNYYNAMDYSRLLAPAICSVARGEMTVSDLWPEWKEDGAEYASVKISGTPATIDTYQQIREEHE